MQDTTKLWRSFLEPMVVRFNIISSFPPPEIENLTPSELKKLRSKQRKAAKREALKQEKQKQEEQKREQANKAKNQDSELDGPKEEELVPDKLAKVN